MTSTPLTPALWFHTPDGTIQTVLDYYQAIFSSHFVIDSIMPLGETPSGNAEMTQVSIFGQPYSMMATAQKHHEFNDAFALIINCQNQDEIDRYWEYLTKEGQEVQCGWCNDKFGLRWQIIPKNMGELMQKSNAWEVMMKQKKIVIAEY
jgi:predicted 3-demethylubiquinone-9 3-methyltransferase (glyoxalase superfamily)